MKNINPHLPRRMGVAFAAAAAFAALPSNAVSADGGVTPPPGISVPAAANATLIASLEGRNELTAGAPQGQALALFGFQGDTLTYSIAWRGMGTPTEADIHAGGQGVDGPIAVQLFTTPRREGGSVSGAVTVTDPALLGALRSNPSASTQTCTPTRSQMARCVRSSTR